MAKAMSLIKKVKKAPRKTKIQQNIIDRKAYGEEPIITPDSTDIELTRALSWYNALTSRKDAYEWLLEYCSEDDYDHLSRLKETKVNKTKCALARIMNNGHTLNIRHKKTVDDHIKDLMNMELDVAAIKKTDVIVNIFKEDKGDLAIADLDVSLDSLDPKFSAYNYLTQINLPKNFCGKLEAYYEPILNELTEALTGTPELKEAYSIYSKPQIKAMHKFVKSIIDDVNRYGDNKKAARKPRAVKKISSESILKFLKYCKEDTKNQLVSVDPERILNASELWTFNSKNNVLSKFVAVKGEKLKVHRSAIMNFDEKLSKSKRVGRKSKEMIDQILGGKANDSLFKISNNDFIKMPDRVNVNVVLLLTKPFK